MKRNTIQFTKAELRMIEAGCKQFLAEWYNGYQSQTRVLTASSVLTKVRAVLAPKGSATPGRYGDAT